ncbi:MAG: hypothetical protein BWY72_01151 [Bacteroidetes bacterium ADurb.Bin416]|nr:MAG: hypothetical protein BWY72_01151 [Bacteroidetes bacterium ADurb.Bin416]
MDDAIVHLNVPFNQFGIAVDQQGAIRLQVDADVAVAHGDVGDAPFLGKFIGVYGPIHDDVVVGKLLEAVYVKIGPALFASGLIIGEHGFVVGHKTGIGAIGAQ